MKITKGMRVRIGNREREIHGLTRMATVTGTDSLQSGTAYYVRDDAGTESVLTRDEITPIPSPVPRATSASVYGIGVTETRKVRASVSRTPSRPRARSLRTVKPGNDPLPPRS